jgi:hypothetical protein
VNQKLGNFVETFIRCRLSNFVINQKFKTNYSNQRPGNLFLQTQITAVNMAAILTAALLYDCQPLRKACFAFFQRYAVTFCNSEVSLVFVLQKETLIFSGFRRTSIGCRARADLAKRVSGP